MKLVTTASVDAANKALADAGVPLARAEDFEPSLVVESRRPFSEDRWKTCKVVIVSGWHAGKFVPLRVACAAAVSDAAPGDAASARAAAAAEPRRAKAGELKGERLFGAACFLAAPREAVGATLSCGDVVEVDQWHRVPAAQRSLRS